MLLMKMLIKMLALDVTVSFKSVVKGTKSDLLDKMWSLEIFPVALLFCNFYPRACFSPFVLCLPSSSVCPSQCMGSGLSVSFGVGVAHGV